VPALPPYLIEPIFEQFLALLPDRVVHHPLGCHKPRIPDRVILEKVVLRFWCSVALIVGSPRKGVGPPPFGTDATSGSNLG
jgi:hypothetical protein